MRDPDRRREYDREWKRLDRAKNPAKYAAYKRGYYERNREAVLDSVSEYQADNGDAIREKKRAKYASTSPESRKRDQLKRLYNITLEQWNEMFKAQDGLCAIRREKSARHVDHCHSTNKVRGLLCGTCNTGIGHLRESKAIMLSAISYLEAHA